MPGTVKIWWHDGAAQDASHNVMPVLREPELGYETIAVDASPSATGPAPKTAFVAVIEADVPVRYLVRPNGGNGQADAASKPLPATGRGVEFVGVSPGYTISFVEA